jgi:hypothetical protein
MSAVGDFVQPYKSVSIIFLICMLGSNLLEQSSPSSWLKNAEDPVQPWLSKDHIAH